jgi:hypothetical protein
MLNGPGYLSMPKVPNQQKSAHALLHGASIIYGSFWELLSYFIIVFIAINGAAGFILFVP